VPGACADLLGGEERLEQPRARRLVHAAAGIGHGQLDLGEIIDAAARAAELTRQLLTFSRTHEVEVGTVDLNAAVESIETLLRRLLGEHIEIETSLDPVAGPVVGTESGLEQIVVNVAVNARDAMPDGGLLRISTLAEPHAGRVRLVVEDAGEGMDEETVARAFEPFFTTKEVGKGTGLGLATVYGIVQQCGGTITIQSRPGEGTRFDVLLPSSQGRVGATPTAAFAAGGGSEPILLVEDEPSVRAVATKTAFR
jgi:signal transduction histidine kinase